MIKTNSAGGIVLNTHGQVLLVNQEGFAWTLPKGHIEPNESIIEAAKREIYEESGLTQLEFVRDLGLYERYALGKNGYDDMSEYKTIFMTLFTTEQMDLKPIDSDNPEAKWVDKNKVVSVLTHPKEKEFF